MQPTPRKPVSLAARLSETPTWTRRYVANAV
jgi:hypothetical protein